MCVYVLFWGFVLGWSEILNLIRISVKIVVVNERDVIVMFFFFVFVGWGIKNL